MLSQPKWLYFWVLFLGIMHLFSYMMDGTYAVSSMPSIVSLDGIKTVLSWDYTWITGDLQIVRWILAALQDVALVVLAYDGMSGLFGWVKSR